jgi:hypothetical protein
MEKKRNDDEKQIIIIDGVSIRLRKDGYPDKRFLPKEVRDIVEDGVQNKRKEDLDKFREKVAKAVKKNTEEKINKI